MYVGSPVINFITNNTVALKGRSVSLICNVTNDIDAVLPLSVVWYYSKHVKLQSDNTFDPVTGQVQSKLLFDPVKHSDSGEYTCYAFNDDDQYTQERTTLTVECKQIKCLCYTVLRVFIQSLKIII